MKFKSVIWLLSVFIICITPSTFAQVNWTSIGPGAGSFLMASAIQPDNPDVIYLGGDIEGVFKTIDGGESWRMMMNGLAGGNRPAGIYASQELVIVGSHFGEKVVAATPSGVVVSHTAKRRSVSHAVPNSKHIRQAIHALEAMSNKPHGAEIAIAFLRAWVTNTNPIVTETKLLRNYPNPFNPETWMAYQLASDAEVAIAIYDIKGALVRQLDLGHRATGYYVNRKRAAYWDGRSDTGEIVSSGLYFYQLTAGDFTVCFSI